MPVPFDAAVGLPELFHGEIVPDKEIRIDVSAMPGEIEEIAVGQMSGAAPGARVLEVIVVAVVDIFNRCVEAGPGDIRLFEQRLDNLEGETYILDAAVDMAIDGNHERDPGRSSEVRRTRLQLNR
jgi:hypothetical protein